MMTIQREALGTDEILVTAGAGNDLLNCEDMSSLLSILIEAAWKTVKAKRIHHAVAPECTEGFIGFIAQY